MVDDLLSVADNNQPDPSTDTKALEENSMDNEEDIVRRLERYTRKTDIHVINAPREGKKLLVLDLDHTLLDFSARDAAVSVDSMKRPHLDAFMRTVYREWDLVIWSQTSWRWLEVKMTELGMLLSPNYFICFVLDKTSMFRIARPDRDDARATVCTSSSSSGGRRGAGRGTAGGSAPPRNKKRAVKALQLIWSKFPRWGAHNTLHVDDLSSNFALSPQNGLRCSAFHRDREGAATDSELLALSTYLDLIGRNNSDLTQLEHARWKAFLAAHVARHAITLFQNVSGNSGESPQDPPAEEGKH